jgi:hypothetical protein
LAHQQNHWQKAPASHAGALPAAGPSAISGDPAEP